MVLNPRWQQLDVLFSQAVDLDPNDRAVFLDEHCSGDPELRAEVESLIHSSEAAPDFLNRPILDSVKKVANEPDLSAGTRIANYQVVRLIGEGGMGQVYLAQDGRLRRNVALKVLPPHLTRHFHALHRFEQEARAASALNHPNIITIFEFGEAGGMHFIASEFVEGETLRKRLAGGAIPMLTALDIASQVASALAAAHANGITHRDIKPENIVIRPDGFVKLLDFGIAKLTEKDSVDPPSATLTGAGMVLGTLKYMSPEQARGVKVDGRSDIFSLGAVLYEMITGKEPFEGETSSDVIAEILKSDPSPLTGPAASACPELQAIVSKAMFKDREGRYQTAAQLSQDLQQLKKDIEFQSHAKQRSGETPASAADQIPRITGDDRRAPARSLVSRALHSWRAGIALAALVIAIVVGFVLLRTQRNASTSRQLRSLAILPFRNLRPDPSTDFLGFSLADALTTKLAYVNALNIRPSSAVDKYRNQVIDPRKVAGELQVDTLLTGSYLKDGDDLRISTQLVDIKADKIIWRDTMDLKYDKLLTVQDRVSQEIVNGLELNLSPAEAAHLRPDTAIDARAYEYYLRGVDLYSLNDFAAAIAILEKSVSVQPNYAPTWAELGRAYETQASLHAGGRDLYRKAQDAYERAIGLSPSLVEPRVYMGNLFTDTGRVEQAVPLLRDALKAGPNNAAAHWELGYAYRFGGMLQQSIEEGERARGFDPQVKINSSAMNGYLYLGQYDKFLQSLPANNSAYVLFYRGFAAYHQKQWHQAAEDLDRAYEMDPTLVPAQVGKALCFGMARQNAQGISLLRKTEGQIEERGVGDAELVYKVAQAYAVLGDNSSALHMLQHAILGGFFCYPYFMRDPLLDGIRSEPGFDLQMREARRRHEEFKARFFPMSPGNGQ
jgi:serine/threonine protein kinase/TolB-like protein/Tfp pilus assembly protein PilF